MKLYFAPRTRSVRPRWLLEELGLPYELVKLDVSKEEHRSPGHLARHPLGDVPVLEDGERTLFVSPAIILYLADRYPEQRLAPPMDSPNRGPYLQWLLFAETTLEPLVLQHHRNDPLPDAERTDQGALLEKVFKVLDARLEGRAFVAGESFTAADLVLASILHLAHNLRLLEQHPKLVDYVLRITARPAARRAVSM